MNFKFRNLSVFWIPLIGFWAFLAVITLSMGYSGFMPYIPIIIYIVFSSLLVYNLQSEITGSKFDDITKVTKSKAAISCLLVSSLIVLTHLFIHSIPTKISIILSLVPLVIYIFISGLFSFSNEQLLEGNKARSMQRDFSITSRESWGNYIEELSISFQNNKAILLEINRIKNILDYSSFFRSEKSIELLNKVKASNDIDQILLILRKVR